MGTREVKLLCGVDTLGVCADTKIVAILTIYRLYVFVIRKILTLHFVQKRDEYLGGLQIRLRTLALGFKKHDRLATISTFAHFWL